MKRPLLAAWLLAIPAFAQNAELPKAEVILERSVQAGGTKEAYERAKSTIVTGNFEVPAQGVKGPFKRYATEGRNYVSIEIPGLGKIESGVTDGVAWENNPMTGPRVKDGLERADALRDAVMHSETQWRKQYTKVETLGEETVEGVATYKVLMTPAEGKPETHYFSKATGLRKKIVKPTMTQMGELDVEMILNEYKEFAGLKTATKMTQRVAGQEVVISIDEVKVNEPIEEARFALPAEIQALVKKEKKD
jgi:hypothetical protein